MTSDPLTIEQRAQRAAKRRNNKTARDLPLLAAMDAIPADMLTTVEEQAARIEKWDRFNEVYGEKLEQHERETSERALTLREEFRKIASAEMFEQMDHEYNLCLIRWPAYQQACYRADYWWCRIREIDPQRAEELRP